MRQRGWPAGLGFLGCGIGYRAAMAGQTLASGDRLDCVELLTDGYLRPEALDEVRRVCEVFPAIPHGVGLSVGSATGLDRGYLAAVKRVSDICGAPYYSEHLCMTRAPGIDLGHLAPLRFTEDVLAQTIRNVNLAQDVLEKPLALENVTYRVVVPRGQMTQPEFFGRLVEATGCGILLDVTNVYINSTNHHFDPLEFIDALPLDRVVHLHIAGGYWLYEQLIDGHSRPVQEGTWELLEAVAERTSPYACILEHDADFPESVDALLDQLDRARAILGAPCTGAAPAHATLR